MPEEQRQKRYRIFIIENNAVFRKGLEQLLNNEHDIIVYGSTNNSTQALSLINRTEPDMVIADVNLRVGSGIDLVKLIHREFTQLPIVVMSLHEESLYKKLSENAGATGYINTQDPPEKIIEKVHSILNRSASVDMRPSGEEAHIPPAG